MGELRDLDRAIATSSTSAMLRPYPTLDSDGGEAHSIIVGFQFGARIDAEWPGYPDTHALGDDNHGDDDEDGVTLDSPLVPGTSSSFTVVVTDVISLFDGVLNAWIDWNQNGSWTDANERIAMARPVLRGSNTLPVSVPANAIPGTTSPASV